MIPLYSPPEPLHIDLAVNYASFENQAYVSAKHVQGDDSARSKTFDTLSFLEHGLITRDISSPSIEPIRSKIYEDLNFPSEWDEQGIARPNIASKARAFELCQLLFRQYSMLPTKVAPTKEEGMYLSFQDKGGSRALIIEIYNNLEVAAIVANSERKIVEYSEDIYGLDLTSAVIALNS